MQLQQYFNRSFKETILQQNDIVLRDLQALKIMQLDQILIRDFSSMFKQILCGQASFALPLLFSQEVKKFDFTGKTMKHNGTTAN